jgi:GNAT superfamily N-acetyltransferase/predicted nucleic acid-binding protein
MQKIVTIREDSPYLQAIIELAKVNAATLGFLPKGAFESQASKGQIIVSIDENNKVLGYLSYGTNRKESLAYITHLCIEKPHRRKGIAKSLFNQLKEVTKERFRGIRVRCRREYEATKVWPKLGFHVSGDIPGRSKEGSILTVWWFDHGHPDLFSYAAKQQARSDFNVVVDANIFFDLIDVPTSENELSHALQADWLNVNLCLTNEIFNEINRNEDQSAREKTWEIARSNFTIIQESDDIFQETSDELRKLFPSEMTPSDWSDLRQIAKTIAGNVQFFITHDQKLLNRADQIYDDFGLRVISPYEFIIHQDSLTREMEYQPHRLAGSLIKMQRVDSKQIPSLDVFRGKEESKAAFNRILRPYLVDPHTFETTIVYIDETPLALFVISKLKPDTLEIPFFRLAIHPLSSTLARHVVLETVRIALVENRLLVSITNNQLHESIIQGLQEIGFIPINNKKWLKANLHIVDTAEAVNKKLETLGDQFSYAKTYFQKVQSTLEEASKNNNPVLLLQSERFLWPAKIIDIVIPSYIVPIWPEWAMHLFDPAIAAQTLFGADPQLFFQTENVYYRASRPMLEAPARILWYVSKRKGHYQQTMSIRAVSYLDEVVVDKPKVLFSQFKRLGVYRWEDVFNVAKNNLEKKVMAFRFSGVELLNSPVHRDKLDQIWQEESKNFNIQGPVKISNEMFLRIYKLGMQPQ